MIDYKTNTKDTVQRMNKKSSNSKALLILAMLSRKAIRSYSGFKQF